jgi:hypothetical protein
MRRSRSSGKARSVPRETSRRLSIAPHSDPRASKLLPSGRTRRGCGFTASAMCVPVRRRTVLDARHGAPASSFGLRLTVRSSGDGRRGGTECGWMGVHEFRLSRQTPLGVSNVADPHGHHDPRGQTQTAQLRQPRDRSDSHSPLPHPCPHSLPSTPTRVALIGLAHLEWLAPTYGPSS